MAGPRDLHAGVAAWRTSRGQGKDGAVSATASPTPMLTPRLPRAGALSLLHGAPEDGRPGVRQATGYGGAAHVRWMVAKAASRTPSQTSAMHSMPGPGQDRRCDDRRPHSAPPRQPGTLPRPKQSSVVVRDVPQLMETEAGKVVQKIKTISFRHGGHGDRLASLFLTRPVRDLGISANA